MELDSHFGFAAGCEATALPRHRCHLLLGLGPWGWLCREHERGRLKRSLLASLKGGARTQGRARSKKQEPYGEAEPSPYIRRQSRHDESSFIIKAVTTYLQFLAHFFETASGEGVTATQLS